jgi:hypothetical protein
VTARRVHAALTAVWVLLIPPSVIWWRNSIPYLVAVSVYANLAGHWAAWEAAKAEQATKEEET